MINYRVIDLTVVAIVVSGSEWNDENRRRCEVDMRHALRRLGVPENLNLEIRWGYRAVTDQRILRTVLPEIRVPATVNPCAPGDSSLQPRSPSRA